MQKQLTYNEDNSSISDLLRNKSSKRQYYGADNIVASVLRDWELGTTRNTAESTVGMTGGGAAAVMVLYNGKPYGGPDISKFGKACKKIEATGNAVAAYNTGEHYSRAAASAFFDKWHYNVDAAKCRKCKKQYLVRLYTEQNRTLCPKCCGEEDYDY